MSETFVFRENLISAVSKAIASNLEGEVRKLVEKMVRDQVAKIAVEVSSMVSVKDFGPRLVIEIVRPEDDRAKEGR